MADEDMKNDRSCGSPSIAWSDDRAQRLRLLNILREQSDVEIVPSTSDLFQRGTDFFSARPDKEWSLTDCISFVAMSERDITDALTSDHHLSKPDFESF